MLENELRRIAQRRVTYVLVPAALVIIAMTACYIPARRASRIDPIRALRYE